MSGVTALGVLDFSPASGAGARAALLSTADLCEVAEQAGYTRYWLGQHYTRSVAHSSPDVLAGILAGSTSRIRVGTAGILLRYDRPLRVACAFRMLETLFPGRIDLGVARGSTDAITARALGAASGAAPEDDPFAAQFGELCRYARSESHETGAPVVIPVGPGSPQIWALGSVDTSGQLAAAHGTALCHALFVRGGVHDPAILRRYRDEFQPSQAGATPLANLAVAGICDEDEARAHEARIEHEGRPIVPTVVGTAAQCAEQLHELAHRFAVNEIVFLDLHSDVEKRQRAHQALAQAVLGAPPV